MSIAKQLLLVTIMNCGLLSQINASQNYTNKQQEKFTKFTTVLSQAPKAEDRNLATWANIQFATNQNLTNELVNSVNANSGSLDDAKAAVRQIYLRETTPQKENTGYFSNISMRVKAAAAFVIAASNASYFYFMRPWSTPSAQ